MKPYLLLENKKKIKTYNIESITETKLRIHLNIKYLCYFNSQNTSIKEIFYKGIFKKSGSLYIRNDIVPIYFVKNNKLFIELEIEEI